MPAPSTIITTVAGLMNDAAQTQYTNAVCLPMLNLALDSLQETFELNGIPTTNKTSALINVPLGTSLIGFSTTPALPSDLVEIQELYESDEGLNQWGSPLARREFIPHHLQDGTAVSRFGMFAWKNNQIELIAASVDIDLKLDYIASIFNTPVLIGNINVDIPIPNIKSFLEFKTAAFCALFIAENETRAMALNGEAGLALDRSLGISVKAMQFIPTRRRPFRAGFKSRKAI